MDFFKKNIAIKTISALFAAFVILGAAGYFLRPFAIQSGVYFEQFFATVVLFVFFIIAAFIFLFNIHLPLRRVFNEMKALLTNRPYKKIFTKRIDEVGILAHFFNEVTKNIERIAISLAEGKRMSKELSTGSDIQRRILPTSMPNAPGISIFGNTRPASEVGGDSFDIITAGPNTFVYVGDVTGHGLPAALIMMMVNTLIRTFAELNTSGYDILVNTNRILKQRIEPRRFMTCVLLRWDASEKKLYYTGGGHEHILIYHRSDKTCEVKQTGGIALGMVSDISKIIKEEQISFETGDFVVIYSDGIIEAKNIEGEMFGLTRLKKAVEEYASTGTSDELFTRISKDFVLFVGDQIQEDDITLIVVARQ